MAARNMQHLFACGNYTSLAEVEMLRVLVIAFLVIFFETSSLVFKQQLPHLLPPRLLA